MKRLRFTLRLIAAIVSKYYLALILGLFLGITGFIVSPRLVKYLPRVRPTHSIAVIGRYALTDIPLSIQQKISTGLTAIDPAGKPAPAIASSWTVDDEGKTYTFTLNSRLTWQDGTPIKSRDINYRFRDAETSYPSDNQVVIKLKDPFAALPTITSRPIFKRGLLGNGTYRAATIRKNGSYIDTLLLVPLDASSRLPKIKYYFYSTEAQARTALKLGIVNTIEDIQDISDLGRWPHVRLLSYPRPDRYVAVFFNTQDPFYSGASGRNLRLALAYAIDKSRWDKDRAYSPINPNSWAYNADVKKFDLDLSRARQLLEKVEKLPDQINLTTVPAYLSTAEAIKSDWEKLGLAVSISATPEIPPDFSVLLLAQAIPIDPDQYNLWHSTQNTNLTRYHNPRNDKLLEDGRKTLDLKQRQTIYQSFQKFLVEEVPAIFLFHPQSHTLIKN